MAAPARDNVRGDGYGYGDDPSGLSSGAEVSVKDKTLTFIEHFQAV